MVEKRHPNKEIRLAIGYALTSGWRIIDAGHSSHAWGRLYCKEESREGCKMSIWSTPKDPVKHAEQICRNVNKCPH